MADIYYLIDNGEPGFTVKTIHYCNTQKDGYTLGDRNVSPPVSQGCKLVIEYDVAGIFYFPDDCDHLFYGITNETISLGNYYIGDMTNVTSTYMMFANAKNLKQISGTGRASWRNLTNVTDTRYMFLNCESLIEFPSPAINMNTSRVTKFESMFSGCKSLTDFSFLENGDTSNVTNMITMFSGCSSMTYLDISKWDMDHEIDVTTMFSNCPKLETIKVKPGTDGNDGTKIDRYGFLFSNDKSLSNGNGTTGIENAHTRPGGYFTADRSYTRTNVYVLV